MGSGEELCVDGNPGDSTHPVINEFSVSDQTEGCFDAYTPLEIKVSTSEPARCRLDIEDKDSFDDMRMIFGGGSYSNNHSTSFSLPSPQHGQSQGMNWSGDLSLFVKCVDRSGLVSPGIVNLDLCISLEADKMPPRLISGDIGFNGLVGVDSNYTDVSVVTDELATCNWDLEDLNYSEMRNSLDCPDSFGKPSSPLGYKCSGTLPVFNSSQDYYVKCMDQPWLDDPSGRNVNERSFVLHVRRPDSKISIDEIGPSGNIEIGSDFTTIDLNIVTSGGGDSHFCSYSFSGYDNMLDMLESGSSRTHSVSLNQGEGEHEIYAECRDETGDFDRDLVEFKIIRDSSSAQIARVWQGEGGINLVLTEEGECRYSTETCKFVWDNGVLIGTGTELGFGVSAGEKYYIRCEDEFGNAPNGCSVELVVV